MDIYTKAVLTVIAISLTALAIENSGILPAHAAQQGAMTVQICGSGDPPAGEIVLSAPKAWDCVHVINGKLGVFQ